MGMDYYVYGEIEAFKPVSFTRELSDFFQGRFGYEEDSEVMQIEKLLDIDFSIFYKISEPDEDDTILIDGSDFLNVINEFIAKLTANPNICAKLKTQEIAPNRNIKLAELQKEFMAAANAKDFDKAMALTKEIGSFNQLPADTGFIKSGRILEDMNDLRRGVEGLLQQGNSKLKLYYT